MKTSENAQKVLIHIYESGDDMRDLDATAVKLLMTREVLDAAIAENEEAGFLQKKPPKLELSEESIAKLWGVYSSTRGKGKSPSENEFQEIVAWANRGFSGEEAELNAAIMEGNQITS